MSTSEELAENLTAYIDGELSELEARRVEEALKADPALAALERRLRVMVTAVEKLEAPAPSRALRRAVLSQLDAPGAWGRLRALFTLPRLVPAIGLAAAAMVTLVLLRGRDVEQAAAPVADAETLFLAQNMDVVEDLDVLGLENPEDLEVVENLHELEATP
jgi:anti-sigma factor RsiW